MKTKDLHWYALYTKPRWEKKIAGVLSEMGVENYCPLNRVEKQWTDRRKVILEPVFRSYVFVKIADKEKWSLKEVSGVLNFVYWLGKPAVIREEEINTIRKFLKEFDDVQVEKIPELQVNTRVRVKQGIMMDYQGMLIELSGSRAKVRIERMGLLLNANFDQKNLELIAP
jgi:transcription antitermination factor NusG